MACSTPPHFWIKIRLCSAALIVGLNMNTGGFNGGVDVAMILVMVLRSHDWVPEMRVLPVRGSRNS